MCNKNSLHDEVLVAYLQRCFDQPPTRADFASNSVLEWFGRTLRGSERIRRFFINDILMHKHIQFSQAEQCKAFETKPTHLETLKDPPENFYPDRLVDISEKTTPPNALRIVRTSDPPPLTQGRRFRPIDSPEESVGLSNCDISGIDELLTPEKTSHNNKSPTRQQANGLRRRLDLQSPTGVAKATAPNKRPSASYATEATSPKQLRTSPRNFRNRFGPLLYLKANGVLRLHRPTKHRGVLAPSTPSTSTSASGIWDREVQLLASYRLCLVDNTPQFALVVYEHRTRNPRTRRNLFVEFDTSSDEEDINQKTPATPILSTADESSNRSSALKSSSAKKASLRRLRF